METTGKNAHGIMEILYKENQIRYKNIYDSVCIERVKYLGVAVVLCVKSLLSEITNR